MKAIYRVYYYYGFKDKASGKYPSDYIKVTAASQKEAKEIAETRGANGGRRVHKWYHVLKLTQDQL